jgi:hypothetical protein
VRAAQAWTLLRQMGPRWVVYRSAYAVRRRLGGLERRFPASDWTEYRLSDLAGGLGAEELRPHLEAAASQFFFRPRDRPARRVGLESILDSKARAVLLSEAAGIREGRIPFFGSASRDVGSPPIWHRHPVTGVTWPSTHWSRIDDGDPSDIKWLWELGRFGFAYTLVRASWLTDERSHAEVFWTLIESWREANPPNRGVHWMCGQECALRVLAWCFALVGFLDEPSTTSARLQRLLEMLVAHGVRIQGNLGFALSQRNNHGINEALALWTLGSLLPFLAPARHWEEEGRRRLEEEASRQIGRDGGYVQHSLNYHRFMLQSYAWALRLADLQGRPFSAALRERFARAVDLLVDLTDDESGGAPNYGSNDGSTLFRLDTLPFGDQRPVLGLGSWIAEGRRSYASGPWDESLFWLCNEALNAPVRPRPVRDLVAAESGYYTVRADHTWGFVRSCVYRSRPAQADMLHLDLWWRGINLMADPGTYSYSASPPWNNALRRTGVHNSVEVDGLDQMEAGSRFTWFGWTRGRVLRSNTDGSELKLIEAEHDGYVDRLSIVHRRTVMLVRGQLWIVIDDVRGHGRHRLRSQWLLPGSQGEMIGQRLRVSSPAGPCDVWFHTFDRTGRGAPPNVERIVPVPDVPLGWSSPHYGHRHPALAVVVEDAGDLPLRRLTLVSLDSSVLIRDVGVTHLHVEFGSGSFEAKWSPPGGTPSMSTLESARFEGQAEEIDRQS